MIRVSTRHCDDGDDPMKPGRNVPTAIPELDANSNASACIGVHPWPQE
jgi:hypothetical protein